MTYNVWYLFCYAFAGRVVLYKLKNSDTIGRYHFQSRMSQPKIKRRVGKYEVGRTIGEGTFAKVKFARNSETGEHVALKILDKEKVLKHKMAEQVCFFVCFFFCFAVLILSLFKIVY